MAIGATVEELQERMDSQEFTRWMALTSEEPIGEVREDWRMARICATITNSQRVKGRPAQMKDYLFRFRSMRPMSDEAMMAVLDQAFKAMG